jgi:hypothetical protein
MFDLVAFGAVGLAARQISATLNRPPAPFTQWRARHIKRVTFAWPHDADDRARPRALRTIYLFKQQTTSTSATLSISQPLTGFRP